MRESEPQVGWREFTPKEGRFSIMMPSKPESEVQSEFTPVGIVKLYIFAAEKDDSYYAVSYSDFPEYVIKYSDVGTVLDDARDGMVANVQGKPISSRRIKLQGYYGRDVKFQVTEEGQVGTAYARIYLVGNRLYQILVIGPQEQFPESEALRFLNSFQLLGGQ
jgi:hypothetical protein